MRSSRKRRRRRNAWTINEAIREVIALTHGEAVKNGVSVRTQLAEGLPIIEGDRVQLQQVILNLIVNAIEAMSGTDEAPRELLISTEKAEPDGVLVAVRDSGPGLAPETLERLFEAFYTTKADGMGMGLSICRSIIEAHGGRLWASANEPRGAVFQFTVPAHAGAAIDERCVRARKWRSPQDATKPSAAAFALKPAPRSVAIGGPRVAERLGQHGLLGRNEAGLGDRREGRRDEGGEGAEESPMRIGTMPR